MLSIPCQHQRRCGEPGLQATSAGGANATERAQRQLWPMCAIDVIRARGVTPERRFVCAWDTGTPVGIVDCADWAPLLTFGGAHRCQRALRSNTAPMTHHFFLPTGRLTNRP